MAATSQNQKWFVNNQPGAQQEGRILKRRALTRYLWLLSLYIRKYFIFLSQNVVFLYFYVNIFYLVLLIDEVHMEKKIDIENLKVYITLFISLSLHASYVILFTF